ncbi:MAG: hypothetical protein A3J10_00090 [Candidatus Sungbacteria bacterium RIFCSPLOWO2_02_FULL_54_10]|uniref:Uncharacterized protein n=1 Tax=Candidatus Sungbacteria bacterium RIFCSPLOWO2_01_FULL_54_21 TaxID=1802279 RepID=A0A1G2L8Z1_9BACT|nr:MAG: hypothetical protein A3B34_02325 [Candidatus Sungbacteria bacterium RIFCSPLOWO2_01_FULL_54_21]OHA12842.1 MAG: hypothetical protein A3J10_00090 [Candidatus Sungbacteria bacterium RIFCSPLOWO2_02_FULL_54_10]
MRPAEIRAASWCFGLSTKERERLPNKIGRIREDDDAGQDDRGASQAVLDYAPPIRAHSRVIMLTAARVVSDTKIF